MPLALAIALLLALAAIVVPFAATSASASNTAGSVGGDAYSNWIDGTSMSATITIGKNPGPQGHVFWSTQFQFTHFAPGTGHGVGYMGIQTSPTGGSLRTSIWGADACTASPLATGHCGIGTEGTEFAGLSLDYAWSINTAYTFTITKMAGDWWNVTVTDHGKNVVIPLGTIHVPTSAPGAVNQIHPEVQWVEFWDWSNPAVVKEGLPTADGTWSAPIVNGVQTKITSLAASPTPALSNTTIVDGGLAANFSQLPKSSAREPITLANDATTGLLGGATAVTLTTINLVAAEKYGYPESWVFSYDGTLRSNFKCLTANKDGSLSTAACANVTQPSQTWTAMSNGEIVNPTTGMCMTAPVGRASSVAVMIGTCTGGANQRFTTPQYTQRLASAPIESITGDAPNGQVGANYTYHYTTVSASGCWLTVNYGSLPPGLNFDAATCTISGTPTTAGTYTFDVFTADGLHYVGPDTITIAPAAVVESISGNAPDTQVGANYTYKYTTNSTTGCWSTVNYGSLPPGLNFDAATCTISGTPTTAGTYTFDVFTADGLHYVGPDTITIAPAAVVESISGNAPDTQVGANYTYKYTTNSTTGCYPKAAYGSFPPGLSFNAATCTLSGTPTTAGTYTFDVFTADVAAYVGNDTITVAPAAAEFITGDAPNVSLGNPYSYRYATNSPDGCYPKAAYGSFPPGLTFDAATCTLSGTPIAIGYYQFDVFTADGAAYVNQDAINVTPPVH